MLDLIRHSVAQAWHLFKVCETDRDLIFGPQVPQGEIWVVTAMHAKDNGGPCLEVNVAVWDTREWICLASKADAKQYDGVDWSGLVVMGPGWRMGTWFRGATPGDVLQSDATYLVLRTVDSCESSVVGG